MLSFSTSARADAAGDAALAQMERALNAAPSHFFEYTAVNGERPERELAFEVRTKGDRWLLTFTAPKDLAGMKLLYKSPTEIYVLLPAFGNRVRRMGANQARENFMGTAWAIDQLTTRYAADYAATRDGDRLTLTPKPDHATSYSKLEITVDKRMLPTKLEYYGANGALVRTETRSGYTCTGDVCAPSELKTTDAGSKLTTTLKRKTWRANEPYADDAFTQRALAQ